MDAKHFPSMQDVSARMQQAQAIAQEGFTAAQDAGKRLLEVGVAHARTRLEQQHAYGTELVRLAGEAGTQAVADLQKQAERCAHIGAEPGAHMQHAITGSLEATQHAMSMWTKALQASVNLWNSACADAVQASQEVGQIVTDTAQHVQTIVREKAAGS